MPSPDEFAAAPPGQGKHSPVPAEIDRWNWGAFLMNWIWGIANGVPSALLMFVPGVNIVVWFLLGARGSRWAWQNKKWTSIADFRSTQRVWTVLGAVLWGIGLLFVGGIAALVFTIGASFTRSEPIELALARLNANPEAIDRLGPPIEPGFGTGKIVESGPQGCALASIPVEGRLAKGRLYLDATRDLGRWRINRLELAVEGDDKRIDLAPEVKGPAQTECEPKHDSDYVFEKGI